MTPFRKKLDSLRDDYRRPRYRGDLAADVFAALDAGQANPRTSADLGHGFNSDDRLNDGGDDRAELLAPLSLGGQTTNAGWWRSTFLPMATTAAIAAAIAVALTLTFSNAGTQPTISTSDPVIALNPTAAGNATDSTNAGTTTGTETTGTETTGTQTTDTGLEAVATAAIPEVFSLVPSVESLAGNDFSLVPSVGSISFDFDLSATGGGESADVETPSQSQSQTPVDVQRTIPSSAREERP